MPNYNLSSFNQTDTGLNTFFEFANTGTGGFFGIFALISVFIITFVSLKNFGNKQAVGGATFSTMIFAFLFRALGAIPDIALFFVFVLVAGTGVMLYLKRD